MLFLGIILLCLSLILKQSFIWHFNISSVLTLENNGSKSFFFYNIKYYHNKSIKIFKNSVSILLLIFFSFLNTFFWYVKWMIFLIFTTKNTNANGKRFFNCVNVSNFDWKYFVFKIKFFRKIFISFVILAGLQSAVFKYLTIPFFKAFIIINILNINQSFSGVV